MNGKGSKRRPALVPEKVVQDRWDRTFGKKCIERVSRSGIIMHSCPPRNEYSHLGDFNDRFDRH
jgi:hypothetical protein